MSAWKGERVHAQAVLWTRQALKNVQVKVGELKNGSSVIPASVFWANAIVQDGHTSLLLLAESRRKYVLLKSIKSGLALLVALILFLL